MLVKKLNNATCINTCNLAAEKDFIALKVAVDKLDISEVVNVLTSLKNLKTKSDDLDVCMLKNVPIDQKKLSHAVSKEAVKNKKKLYQNKKN